MVQISESYKKKIRQEYQLLSDNEKWEYLLNLIKVNMFTYINFCSIFKCSTNEAIKIYKYLDVKICNNKNCKMVEFSLGLILYKIKVELMGWQISVEIVLMNKAYNILKVIKKNIDINHRILPIKFVEKLIVYMETISNQSVIFTKD